MKTWNDRFWTTPTKASATDRDLHLPGWTNADYPALWRGWQPRRIGLVGAGAPQLAGKVLTPPPRRAPSGRIYELNAWPPQRKAEEASS